MGLDVGVSIMILKFQDACCNFFEITAVQTNKLKTIFKVDVIHQAITKFTKVFFVAKNIYRCSATLLYKTKDINVCRAILILSLFTVITYCVVCFLGSVCVLQRFFSSMMLSIYSNV